MYNFLENIHKDFILDKEYPILERYFYLLPSLKSSRFDLGEIVVKVIDIDMSQLTLTTTSIENIDELTNHIVDLIISKLRADSKKYLKVLNKVIDAWEKKPETFKKKEKGIFYNETLLTDNEYMTSLWSSFDKIYFVNNINFRFSTGCGKDTYYSKDFYQKNKNDLENFLLDTENSWRSAKIKKRISNTLSKLTINLPFNEIESSLTLKSEKVRKKEKPPFPFSFNAYELNEIACEITGYVDENVIEELKEREIDISKLNGWEIDSSHEGEHYNDGQICEYTLHFISPDGHEYCFYNNHCLVTGWTFEDPVLPPI